MRYRSNKSEMYVKVYSHNSCRILAQNFFRKYSIAQWLKKRKTTDDQRSLCEHFSHFWLAKIKNKKRRIFQRLCKTWRAPTVFSFVTCKIKIRSNVLHTIIVSTRRRSAAYTLNRNTITVGRRRCVYTCEIINRLYAIVRVRACTRVGCGKLALDKVTFSYCTFRGIAATTTYLYYCTCVRSTWQTIRCVYTAFIIIIYIYINRRGYIEVKVTTTTTDFWLWNFPKSVVI